MNGRYRDLFPAAGRGRGLGRIAGRGAYMPPRMDEDLRRAMEMGRARILVVGIFMALVFTVIGALAAQAFREIEDRTIDGWEGAILERGRARRAFRRLTEDELSDI